MKSVNQSRAKHNLPSIESGGAEKPSTMYNIGRTKCFLNEMLCFALQ